MSDGKLYSWQSKERMFNYVKMFNYLKKVSEKSYLVALVDYFRILKALIILFLLFELCLLFFIIFIFELCSKSKWQSSGRNASWFQFRCCEINIKTSTFQNDPSSFSSSSKISPHFSVTLSQTTESITNGSVG